MNLQKKTRWMGSLSFVFFAVFTGALQGCMSAYRKQVGAEVDRVESKIYLIDYELAWGAVLESLKTSPLEVVNRESGEVQSKWIDNTAERNFIDSPGTVGPYLKARYRILVRVSRGFTEGRPSVKISIQKEQQYQRDVLEGWRPLASEGIQEQTLLYRIGKVMEMRAKLQSIEDAKIKKKLKN